jgi:predicted metal-dependent HD superfamily phosphohydrolase
VPPDQQRWTRLWTNLGARGTGLPLFAQLTAAYAEPGRSYHTLTHLQDCLQEFDNSRRLADHPHEVEAALWFHDAVYVPGASDNEEKSAELARRALTEARVRPDSAERVANLVQATRHATLPTSRDEQLICDIDLSILGRERRRFAEFEEQIRREYAWVPAPQYRHERSAVLTGFLARPSIYWTEEFRERYEVRARENLQRLLSELTNG